MGKRDTRVFVAEGEMEAQQVRAFLESNDIPCRFHGEALRKTHGLTLNGLGLVEVHVPEAFVERARELLALAESGKLRLKEDEEAG